MKQFINLKKCTAVVIATMMAFTTISCGKEKEEDVKETRNISEEEKEPEPTAKPEIKVRAVIDTVFGPDYEASSWAPFVEEFKKRKNIELDFVKPVHNEYFQQLTLMYASDNIPDIIEIGPSEYPTYVNDGKLWDMTEAWDKSELKESGIVDERYVDVLKIDDALYGFPMTHGNGTVTYIRQDWLDNLGLSVPNNYDEFNNMLKQFTYGDPDGNGKNDTYGITMPGLVSDESPYDIFPREYYQDAVPGIYQKEDGTWVDGMSEPAMIEALKRMKSDYDNGFIDKEVATNKMSTSREKFYNGQVGTFNYWAGNWSVTLQKKLTEQNPKGVVVSIPAIAETNYIERTPTAIAITTKADDKERIFEDIIMYSHDGSDGQLLFSHGVEGANYTVSGTTYTKLKDPESDRDYDRSWYSPEMSITKFKDPFVRPDSVDQTLSRFYNSAEITPLMPTNDIITNELPNILSARNKAIVSAVTNKNTTIEDAIKTYEAEVANAKQQVLTSLN